MTQMGQQFDVGMLLKDYEKVHKLAGGEPQIAVTCPQDIATESDFRQLSYMVGTNWDHKIGRPLRSEKDFTEIVKPLKGSYTETVINSIKATDEHMQFGRIRFLTLLPKTSYSFHADLEDYRLHIPLKTNDGCFFIWEEGGDYDSLEAPHLEIKRLNVVGQLYRVRVSCKHTAVNAHMTEPRIHLVINIVNPNLAYNGGGGGN